MKPIQDPTPHEWLSFKLESEAIYFKACKLLPAFKEAWPTFEAWYALSLNAQDAEIDELGTGKDTTPEFDDLLALMFERSQLADRLFSHVLVGGALSPSAGFPTPETGNEQS